MRAVLATLVFVASSGVMLAQDRTVPNSFGGSNLYMHGHYAGRTLPNAFHGEDLYDSHNRLSAWSDTNVFGGQDWNGWSDRRASGVVQRHNDAATSRHHSWR
jgi:hypothetical protein